MVDTVNPGTADQLIEGLKLVRAAEEVIGSGNSPCRGCQVLAVSYVARIATTREKEKLFRDSKEESDDEKRYARQISQAVRLEATCARRFMLHLIKDHK